MRTPLRIAIAMAFAGLCVLGWIALRESPILAAREPAPALTADARLYLDREYRLDAVPPELAGASLVPTTRHDPEPVHLRLSDPGSLVLLTVDSRPPLDPQQDWTPMPIAGGLRVRGTAVDLTRAWRAEIGAGDHRISARVPTRIASPILVLGGGEVRRIETPAGLIRRAELATRGWPRRGLAAVLALVVLLAVVLFAFLVRRRRPEA